MVCQSGVHVGQHHLAQGHLEAREPASIPALL